MIYVFYHNDPLAQDLGGGAEHFRCLHRALAASDLPFRLIATRLQPERSAAEIVYIAQRLRLPALLPGALGVVLAPPRRLRRRGRVPLPPQLRRLAEAAARTAAAAGCWSATTTSPAACCEGWLGPARGTGAPADAGARAPGGGAGRRHRLRQRARPPRARPAGGARAVHPRPCRPGGVRRRPVRRARRRPARTRARQPAAGPGPDQPPEERAAGGGDAGSTPGRRRAVRADHRRPRRGQQGPDPADRLQPGRQPDRLDRRGARTTRCRPSCASTGSCS